MDSSKQDKRELLIEQLLWLIQLRWVAIVGLVTAALVAQYALTYPLLSVTVPIYICAGILLLFNVISFYVTKKTIFSGGFKDIVLAMFQVVTDLAVLTAVLLFSGGVVNPFALFYIFHVIIAAMILPRNLSYGIGLATILLFGLLTVNELNEGQWLGHYPLKLSSMGGLSHFC